LENETKVRAAKAEAQAKRNSKLATEVENAPEEA